MAGISAFPMPLGGDIAGTFTVYRNQRGRAPDHTEWIDTAIAGDLAASALLADKVNVDRQLHTADPSLNLTVAVGMLSAQFDVSIDDAVNTLRRSAARLKMPVSDIAADVIWRLSAHNPGRTPFDGVIPPF